MAGKRKRAINDLDHENKCITGQAFVQALQSENERKERDKKEKEYKSRE